MDESHDWLTIRDARDGCRSKGREVLTPLAAAALFDISEATVRIARLRGFVATALDLRVTGKPVYLLLLDSAIRYWGEPDDLEARLDEYRANGTTMSVGTLFYNILHPESIVTIG